MFLGGFKADKMHQNGDKYSENFHLGRYILSLQLEVSFNGDMMP